MKEKFEEGLRELIAMMLDANMHPSEMIEALEKELAWCREPTLTRAGKVIPFPKPTTETNG